MDRYKLNSFSEIVVSPDGKHYVYVLVDDVNKVLHISETSYAILTAVRAQSSLDFGQIVKSLKDAFEIEIPDSELEKDVQAHIVKLCQMKVLEKV